jgi:DNA repair protein RecO (recombination protein O)
VASRARLQRTEAIVLSRRDFGEADRILTVYTRAEGKLGVIAKGVRRIASRKAGHLELFTHVELLLAQGRSLDVVTQAATIEPFRALREDLVRTAYAYHVSELLDHAVGEGEASPPTFELLHDALHGLCVAEDPSLVVRAFDLRLLGLLGYRPQLFACVRCGGEVGPEGNAYSAQEGGVLCPRCAARAQDAVALDGGAFRVLRFLQTHPVADAARMSVSGVTRAVLEQLAHATLRHHLERQLRSVDFLQRLRGIAAELELAPGAPRRPDTPSERTRTR